MAVLDESVFCQLEMVFKAYSDGRIEGTNLNTKDMNGGGVDLKHYKFKPFLQVKDTNCQIELLQELLDKKMDFKSFTAECQLITKRRQAQNQFMKETRTSSWEEATREYPRHTTAAAMDRFTGFNFKRSLPDVWRDHISSAKRFKTGTGMNKNE